MERSFIATKESRYYKNFIKYQEDAERQRVFVKEFFKKSGVETREFYIIGDGMVGIPFDDYDKKNITLAIMPTEKDINSFGKYLLKPDHIGLRAFRKNSKFAKVFAQKCIDEQIVINIYHLDLRDYFKSIDCASYNYSRIPCEEGFYIKIESKGLNESEIPEGFTEIKLSEFHKAKEEFESK
jgi:hypothetical protein